MADIAPNPLALARSLHAMGEHSAAGYMEEPAASPMRRWSRTVRRRFEHRSLPAYDGQLLYPFGPLRCGEEDETLSSSYSFTWSTNTTRLDQQLETAGDEDRRALLALRMDLQHQASQLNHITTPHTVGGRGYTHSVPNYGRILREGLGSYTERISSHLSRAAEAGAVDRTDFYTGLLDVVTGIRAWHTRLIGQLQQTTCGDPQDESQRVTLIAALGRVPFQPATTFFEAVVAYNLCYYLDDCDNPGRVDLEMSSYFDADLAAGLTTKETAVDLIRCLWENCNLNDGWSAGIGGTRPDGDSAYSELTLVCLEAARSIRRPNLQLHVCQDMPDQVWDAVLTTIATGCGLPALYNEEAFTHSLRDAGLGIREADLSLYNGGGCTVTMIHGLSNVGSLDAGIHLTLILTQTLEQHLEQSDSLADFLAAYQRDIVTAIDGITTQVYAQQEAKARLAPQPMRSLLIDDCIDSGLEFNDGGARYNWSVINVAGLATVVDSLAAVREVVFEKQEVSGAQLMRTLRQDFEDDEAFRLRLACCPRFGNDEVAVDSLARTVSGFVFQQFLDRVPWRGGKFLASCLMFTTYAAAGGPIGATPDGRRAGEPIADSAGPHQGRDRMGPTAMLRSVASIPQHLAPGTLVVNARFSPELFDGEARRTKLQQMVRTYFDLGGMQLQVNVVDQAVLEDAIAHPESHQDLVVRIGGFSEYFNRLSPELKQTLLQRTEHAA